MELAAIIINAGIFVATVIAAIIARRSVVDARDARDDAADSEREAAKSRDAAVDAATRSATASERSADALERQVALAEEAARTPDWTVTEAHAAGRRWKFQNTSGDRMSGVSVEIEQSKVWVVERAIPDPIAAGQSFFVASSTYLDVPTSITLSWSDPAGASHEADFSIN